MVYDIDKLEAALFEANAKVEAALRFVASVKKDFDSGQRFMELEPYERWATFLLEKCNYAAKETAS